MVSRWSCDCWIRTTSEWGFGSSALRNPTSGRSAISSACPYWIVRATGPTGSGKTTTLYAVLNQLNRPDVKIITAEDPVEYYLPGINQVEVRHNIGLDFAPIIRAMLRQAPERDPSGGNAGCGDGPDGHSGIFDGTLGIQYTAYERYALSDYAA